MADRVVVDASALAAILFSEPEEETVRERIDGAILVAPDLIALELANICVKKVRRYPAMRDQLLAALADFQDLDVVMLDVDPQCVAELALARRLTAYDASYLWLAIQLGAELITLDKELGQAAAH